MEQKQEQIQNQKQAPETDSSCSGMQLELESLRQEYLNLFDRSNKLDNKVYITITFCGFLFVFITGLFSGISQLAWTAGGIRLAVAAVYICTCIAVMISYVYLLLYLLKLLRPEQIVRMDPEVLEKEKFETIEGEEAYRCLIGLYREIINVNLKKLKNRCDEFTKGLRFVVPTVILAFAAYAFQLIAQMIG